MTETLHGNSIKIKMAEIADRQKSILDSAKDGRLSPDEVQEYDALNREWELEKKTLDLIPTPRRVQPVLGDIDSPWHSGGSGTSLQTRRTTGGRKYADLFGTHQLSNDGWNSADEFYNAVVSGGKDPKLQQLGQTVGSPSGGGFAVPEFVAAEMLDASLEHEVVRPRATVVPMTSATWKSHGFDNSTASGSVLFGGLTARWEGEGDNATEDTLELRKVDLTAKKMFLFTRVSNELDDDAPNFVEGLSNALISAAGWNLDDKFLTGTGGATPTGVLNDSALVTVTKETGQAAATINYENAVKMYARLHPALVKGAVWVANLNTIPSLQTMAITIGTGGSHIPALREDGSGGFSILNIPVAFTEKVATLGTVGDFMLVNFSEYIIGIRKQVSVDFSMHEAFASDQLSVRAIVRVDAIGRWKSAYTPKTGSTLSWCVALETRS